MTLQDTLKRVLCTGETLEQFCDRIDKDFHSGELKIEDAYRVLRHVMTGLIYTIKQETNESR